MPPLTWCLGAIGGSVVQAGLVRAGTEQGRAPKGHPVRSRRRKVSNGMSVENVEKKYMVLTAIGADRPGLVERVASLIHLAGGNLEDSRMAILGGEFALILLFSGQASVVQAVKESHHGLAQELGLTMSLRPTTSQRQKGDFLPYRLRVAGVDRSGIVARVSAVLTSKQVNVSALDSSLSYAPHSGTPLFQLRADLEIPSRLALTGLRASLAALCDEENLDFTLEPGT